MSVATDEAPKPMENPLANAPSSLQWMQTLELGYDEPPTAPTVCFGCGKAASEDVKFSICSKCSTASYCSRDCQVSDWKQGRHKLACDAYLRLAKPFDDSTRATVRTELFARIRFYACPYAVHKTSQLGKGFLFIQSNTTLEDLSVPIPKDRTGRTMTARSILMHFLTLGEYDSEVCREDFEITAVRTKLQEAVADYDTEKEVVLLYRFRCGHVALGRAVLVPDFKICKQLGENYYADNPAGMIQLNLDDL